MPPETIAVVGAGVIGVGVAQTFLDFGFPVILLDRSPEALSFAERSLHDSQRLTRLLRASIPRANAAGMVQYTTEFDALKAADFIIENVTETWEQKKAVHQAIDPHRRPTTILGVNTSTIPISRIAALTRQETSVIGIHFMNPVSLIPTVELIRGSKTDEQTLAKTEDLLRRVGKAAVLVGDVPGFVSNRLLMLLINEAALILDEHVAEAPGVDRIFRDCFGHKMGPLETADLIGLDTVLDSINSLFESYQESKYRPCGLLERMVFQGHTGMKSGRGFYEYL